MKASEEGETKNEREKKFSGFGDFREADLLTPSACGHILALPLLAASAAAAGSLLRLPPPVPSE